MMQDHSLTVAEKILFQKGGVNLYHFSAESGAGIRQWYVLRLFFQQEDEFTRAIQQAGANIDLMEYGQVLASGPGNAAPEFVKLAIKERYGVEVPDNGS